MRLPALLGLLAVGDHLALASPVRPTLAQERLKRTHGGGGGSNGNYGGNSSIGGIGGGGGSLGDGFTTSGYAPERVPCPNGTVFVRPAEGLNTGEQTWVNERATSDNFAAYLSSVNLSAADLNLSSSAAAPVIGLAFSGGGYRAMLSGGGQLYALDPRNAEAVAAGTAFLPAVAYIAGLSGGSWLTASYLAHASVGNTSVLDLEQGQWNLTESVITDAPGQGVISAAEYYANLVKSVGGKGDAGFSTGITDYWGLALGAHLFPPQYSIATGSPNLTISDLRGVPPSSAPFPIIIAAEREAGDEGDRWLTEASIWEFTPYEFGSWGWGGGLGNNLSRNGGGFTPVEFVGTSLENGRPNATQENDAGQCTVGFDNLAFVVGTASTLFNTAYAALANSTTAGVLASALESILGRLSAAQVDVALVPNPFVNWRTGSNPTANLSDIALVDAGETLQNVPFEPLLVPDRHVDVIIGFDNSADQVNNWPNGTAPSTTARRFNALSNSIGQQSGVSPPPLLTPSMPTEYQTFLNLGLNTRPTFFGCSPDPTPTERDMSVPLIVYVPSWPWIAGGNTSTFQMQYTDEESSAVFWNGVRTLTLNGTLASNWSTCLACALADRAVARAGNARSDICTSCFATWCWNGTTDATNFTGVYAPEAFTVPPFLASLGVTPTRASGEVAPSPSASAASSDDTNGTNAGVKRAGGGVGALAVGLGALLAVV